MLAPVEKRVFPNDADSRDSVRLLVPVMQTFKNQTISDGQCSVKYGPEERHNLFSVTRNRIIEDLELLDCQVIGGGLTTYGAPVHRSTARNIRIINFTVNSFFGCGAVFDEVTINGLRTSVSPVILHGCALRHVTLSGEVGRFLFNSEVTFDNERRNQAFRVANTEFYDSLDWALDISNVKAACIEIRGSIPSRLIRRNPEEQFVMTREVAESGDWKRYDPYPAFDIGVSSFLASGSADNVFVAARRSRHFKKQIEFFHRLRTHGLVT